MNASLTFRNVFVQNDTCSQFRQFGYFQACFFFDKRICCFFSNGNLSQFWSSSNHKKISSLCSPQDNLLRSRDQIMHPLLRHRQLHMCNITCRHQQVSDHTRWALFSGLAEVFPSSVKTLNRNSCSKIQNTTPDPLGAAAFFALGKEILPWDFRCTKVRLFSVKEIPQPQEWRLRVLPEAVVLPHVAQRLLQCNGTFVNLTPHLYWKHKKPTLGLTVRVSYQLIEFGNSGRNPKISLMCFDHFSDVSLD